MIKQDKPASAKPERGNTAEVGGRHLILIAEDNIVNQRLALLQIRQLGFDGHIVDNGRDAVSAVASGTYSLVLMDWQMPELDGLDATRAIRRAETSEAHVAPRHIPIIAMTANSLQGDRETCLEAGMDDYLAKPITIAELHAALSRWLPSKLRS